MYFRTSSKIIQSCTIEEDINYVRGCKFLYLNLRKQSWLKKSSESYHKATCTWNFMVKFYVYHFSVSISCSSKRTSSKIQDVLVVFCFALQVEPMLNFLKGYLTAVSVPVFSRLLGCSLPNGAKAAVQMLQFICCGKKPGSPRTWLVCVIFLFPFLGVCDRKIPCH